MARAAVEQSGRYLLRPEGVRFIALLLCVLDGDDLSLVAKLYADYHVGMSYRMVGNFPEALKWLRPVLAWAERLGNHSVIGQACEDLGEIGIAGGDRKEGMAMLRRARDSYKAEKFDQTWPEIWENINHRLKELGG